MFFFPIFKLTVKLFRVTGLSCSQNNFFHTSKHSGILGKWGFRECGETRHIDRFKVSSLNTQVRSLRNFSHLEETLANLRKTTIPSVSPPKFRRQKSR